MLWKRLQQYVMAKKRKCMPDISERAQANDELDIYNDKLGEFGSKLAQRTISRSPGIIFLELMNLIYFFT